jgi:hypothetical protein
MIHYLLSRESLASGISRLRQEILFALASEQPQSRTAGKKKPPGSLRAALFCQKGGLA